MTLFSVQQGNVLDVPSDLLILKHARGFYGADQAVAQKLIIASLCSEEEISPPPGDCALVETRGAIAPKRVLFIGTPPLQSFSYGEMQRFAYRAMEKVGDLRLQIQTITTTVHGTGYGLDGGEALQRLIKGFQEGLSRYHIEKLEQITFLTLGQRAVRMLSGVLKAMKVDDESTADGIAQVQQKVGQNDVPNERITDSTIGTRTSHSPSQPIGETEVAKKRVFVALPFSEEFQNVYEFGIYPAVRDCGFICERVDETHFTGDILGRIREGIETASLVIADLTEGRPNVYLEVGYAWGKGVPVIFVARKGEQLHFDVSTHRCIFYGRFAQFARDLEELIRGIQASMQG